MPNPKSKDEGKSLAIEASSSKEEKSSSSATAEKRISKSFLIKDWDKNKNNISMIGITVDKEQLDKSKEGVEIILRSKIVSINKLFAEF